MKKIETLEHLFLYPTDIYIRGKSTIYNADKVGYIGFVFPENVERLEQFMDNKMLEKYWYKNFHSFGWTNNKSWWELEEDGFIKIK